MVGGKRDDQLEKELTDKRVGSAYKRNSHKRNSFDREEKENHTIADKLLKGPLTLDDIQNFFKIRPQSNTTDTQIFTRNKTKSQASLNEGKKTERLEINPQGQVLNTSALDTNKKNNANDKETSVLSKYETFIDNPDNNGYSHTKNLKKNFSSATLLPDTSVDRNRNNNNSLSRKCTLENTKSKKNRLVTICTAAGGNTSNNNETDAKSTAEIPSNNHNLNTIMNTNTTKNKMSSTNKYFNNNNKPKRKESERNTTKANYRLNLSVEASKGKNSVEYDNNRNFKKEKSKRESIKG